MNPYEPYWDGYGMSVGIRPKHIIGRGRPYNRHAPSLDGASIDGGWGRARGLMGGVFMGTLLAQQSSWKNPYVTDGLVAMLDGEWNAGPGKRDENATEWTDVMGNVQLNHVYPYYWGSNYVMIDRSHSVSHFYSPELLNAIKNGGFYVEVALRNMTSFNRNGAIICVRNGDLKRFFELFSVSNTTGGCNSWRSTSATGWIRLSPGHRAYLGIYCNPDTNRIENVVHNYDRVHTDSAARGSVSVEDGTPFCLGSWNIRTNSEPMATYYCTDLRIHCIRFYSRRPSDAGVAANYAVDVQRFGAPA